MGGAIRIRYPNYHYETAKRDSSKDSSGGIRGHLEVTLEKNNDI